RDPLGERLWQELAGLLAEIEQDRARFEDADRLSARGAGIDERGDLLVRTDLEEVGRHLLALADVHRDYLVGQPHFLQRDRDLAAVRRVPGVQFDCHSVSPQRLGSPYPETSGPYNPRSPRGAPAKAGRMRHC